MPWPISDRSDAEWVRAARDGQAEAFNGLVRRWERKIYTYLLYLTREPEESFDLCQEVFVSAYRNLSRLQAPEKFGGWLFRIAHNAAYSYLRARANPSGELPEIEVPGPVMPAEMGRGAPWTGVEMKLLVERALAALPVEQREAILLKIYQGLRFDEIAAIQDCPSSTVKTRVYTGLLQLRKLIQS